MVIEKTYYGKKLQLLVVRNDGEIQFKYDDRIFSTLTAAARHVRGDPTCQISGPLFWGVRAANTRR
jgi:hypothetical protein